MVLVKFDRIYFITNNIPKSGYSVGLVVLLVRAEYHYNLPGIRLRLRLGKTDKQGQV